MANSPQKSKINFVCFKLFIVYFIIHFILFFSPNYFPQGDDFALITHSTPYTGKLNLFSFVTEGFQDYFQVFPEWTIPFSNFMRPVANFAYFTNYLIFGEQWEYYLLFGYIINSLGITLVFLISLSYLRLSLFSSILASCIMFLSTAYAGGIHSPSFIFDSLAAVLSILSFMAVSHNKIFIAMGLLTLAIFTKETVLFVPFAIWITSVIMTAQLEKTKILAKEILKRIFLIFPVLIWILLRVLFFEGIKGTSVIEYLKNPISLFTILQKILFWPAFIGKYQDILILEEFLKGQVVSGLTISILKIILNLTFILLLLFLFLKVFLAKATDKTKSLNLIIVIWLLGISSVLVTLSLEKRFAYIFFLLLIPFLFYQLRHYKNIYLKTLIIIFLTVAAVDGMTEILKYGTRVRSQEFKKQAKINRDLVDIVSKIPLKSGQTIFLINDITGKYSAQWIGDFSKKKTATPFIVLNGIVHSKSLDDSFDIKISKNQNSYIIKLKLSKGNTFAFAGADTNLMISKAMVSREGIKLSRGNKLVYTFPKAEIKQRMITRTKYFKYSNELIIQIKNSEGIFIYFDPKDEKYKVYKRPQFTAKSI